MIGRLAREDSLASVGAWNVAKVAVAVCLILAALAARFLLDAGQDSAQGKIVELVAEAEKHRAPILRVAESYAKWFTPALTPTDNRRLWRGGR